MKTGIEIIAEERARHQDPEGEEGFAAAHDDAHTAGELAMAGAAYAVSSLKTEGARAFNLWPWRRDEFNPKADRLRDLARGGALIAAEIDRLLRKQEREKLNAAAEEEQP